MGPPRVRSGTASTLVGATLESCSRSGGAWEVKGNTMVRWDVLSVPDMGYRIRTTHRVPLLHAPVLVTTPQLVQDHPLARPRCLACKACTLESTGAIWTRVEQVRLVSPLLQFAAANLGLAKGVLTRRLFKLNLV